MVDVYFLIGGCFFPKTAQNAFPRETSKSKFVSLTILLLINCRELVGLYVTACDLLLLRFLISMSDSEPKFYDGSLAKHLVDYN